MNQALPWLTFVAALIAAVGTFVGPIIAYRAAIRTLASQRQIAQQQLRQDTIDQLVVQATGDNPRLSSYALAQLEYLLDEHKLTVEQTKAARNAIDAVTARLEPTVEGVIRVEEDSHIDRSGS